MLLLEHVRELFAGGAGHAVVVEGFNAVKGRALSAHGAFDRNVIECFDCSPDVATHPSPHLFDALYLLVRVLLEISIALEFAFLGANIAASPLGLQNGDSFGNWSQTTLGTELRG